MKDLQQENGTVDLSKPFFRSYREGDNIITEINQPNDTVGDFAFEWDVDGSQRKKWEEYIKELEEKGIRGQLTYSKWVMKYNPIFDESSFTKTDLGEISTYPLSSYKIVIEDNGNI